MKFGVIIPAGVVLLDSGKFNLVLSAIDEEELGAAGDILLELFA